MLERNSRFFTVRFLKEIGANRMSSCGFIGQSSSAKDPSASNDIQKVLERFDAIEFGILNGDVELHFHLGEQIERLEAVDPQFFEDIFGKAQRVEIGLELLRDQMEQS